MPAGKYTINCIENSAFIDSSMLPADILKSSFLCNLLEINRPYMDGFTRWVFQPGMLFQSWETWWGEKKPRTVAHEGIDLCTFEDVKGLIKHVDGSIKIPAVFPGTIVKIDRDFLGRSIFISHNIYAADDRQLYVALGHTNPGAARQPGNKVEEGEVIATISSPPQTAILPHLHITLAWIPVPLSPDYLTWKNLGRDKRITLIDPLPIL